MIQDIETHNYIESLKKELEHYKGIITELSLMIGMLRGCLFEFEDSFDQNKTDTIKRIDKRIELLFYTGHFKAHENT